MQRLFHSTSFIFVFAKIKRLKIYTKSENPQSYYSFPKLHFHIISKRVAKSSERKNVLRSFLRISTCRLRLQCKLLSFAMVLQYGWKQRWTVIKYARKSLGWFIYTWANTTFFRRLTAKKTSLPLPAERLSSLYIQ